MTTTLAKKKMYEWLKEIAEEKNGFTVLTTLINKDSLVEKREVLNALERTRKVMEKRYREGRKFFCAFVDTQNSFGEPGFKQALKVSHGAEQILGGWKENDKIYFDSVHNYFTKQAAMEAARKNDQLAIAEFGLDGCFANVINV